MDAAEALTTMPTTDRHPLRFAEMVEENFSFLQEHEFKRLQSEPTFVRFESRRSYVNVYHGRRSFEIGLEIGLLGAGSDEIPHSMSEIIRLVEPEKLAEYRDYGAHTAEDVAEGVRGLAARFRRYVDAGILDDAGFFERLRESHKAAVDDYWKKGELTQARRELDAAWHAKNYAKVVEVLEPLRADLTSTELKKLEYAKKELG
jgi:hypothetical protein